MEFYKEVVVEIVKDLAAVKEKEGYAISLIVPKSKGWEVSYKLNTTWAWKKMLAHFDDVLIKKCLVKQVVIDYINLEENVWSNAFPYLSGTQEIEAMITFSFYKRKFAVCKLSSTYSILDIESGYMVTHADSMYLLLPKFISVMEEYGNRIKDYIASANYKNLYQYVSITSCIN